MSTARYKGVKKATIAKNGSPLTASGGSVVEGKKPGVTLECEKYLNDKEKLASLSGPVKKYHISELMDKCGICEVPINKSKDKYYPQELIENDKIIPVILCDGCMAELHKCPRCGIPRPYCSECV